MAPKEPRGTLRKSKEQKNLNFVLNFVNKDSILLTTRACRQAGPWQLKTRTSFWTLNFVNIQLISAVQCLMIQDLLNLLKMPF